MPRSPATKDAPVRDLAARVHGVYVIFAALVIGALGWLALRLLAPIAAENMDDLPRFVRFCITHRAWMPLTAAPALLCGLVLLSAPRRSCLLIVIALVAMMLPFAIVLCCFIAILAPWYRVQPP